MQQKSMGIVNRQSRGHCKPDSVRVQKRKFALRDALNR